MNNIVEVKNLHKNYHNLDEEIVALDDVSFTLGEGEFVAIIGPSGCGKSTILSIIADIEKKTSGDIIFSSDDITFGYMLQEDSLFPWLNILDNCLLGLKIKGNILDSDREYVISLLNTYGLKDFIYKYPRELSGGMRQRVALIRTLAMKPDILLLDEPFSALDYQTRVSLSDDIYKMIKDNNKSVIMITHDIAEAISMADRVIVLTNRPSKVKMVYDINLSDKGTPINNRNSQDFPKYYDMLWKCVDKSV